MGLGRRMNDAAQSNDAARGATPVFSSPAAADVRAANADTVDPSLPDGDQGPLSLPHVCWLFMGLGVYRAWIEVCFVGSFVSYPAPYGMRSLFDVACVAVLFADRKSTRLNSSH